MNIHNLTKRELLSRLTFRCKHRHNGLDHPNCYDKLFSPERIAFVDIETSGLKADFAITWCYAIKPENGKLKINVITPKEISQGSYDKRLCKDFIEDITNHDRLVGHYGCRFDFPFMRARSVYWGLDFPAYGSIKQSDTWLIMRRKFKIHSNRLQSACDFFNIPAKGHPMKQEIWLKAFQGDKSALKYMGLHCREDVLSTEGLWHKIKDYTLKSKTSI